MTLTFAVLIIAALATACIWGGMQTIAAKAYTHQWESRQTFLVFSRTASGTETFVGGAAIRIGCGFIAFGALLALWATGIVISAVSPASLLAGTRTLRAFATAGLVLLTTTCALFFPPWTLSGGVLGAIAILFFIAIIVALTYPHLQPLPGTMFVGLILTALTVANFAREAAWGIALGLIVGVIAFIHALPLLRIHGQVMNVASAGDKPITARTRPCDPRSSE